MFSALKHYPPATISLKPNGLPVGIGNDRSTVIDNGDVSGSFRFKYSYNPVIMSEQPEFSGQVIYAKEPVKKENLIDNSLPKQTRTVGSQSTYRISETQTDPYSPDYIYDSSLPIPELVSLSNLVYCKGLPAGQAQVEMIERARAKKAWELTLPPLDEKGAFEERVKMIEEMELREWKDKEMEIKLIQDERLRVLEAVIRTREKKNDVENEKRLEDLMHRKVQEKQDFLEKINVKRIKETRKLQTARANIEKKPTKRDIISEYGNYSSRVYAPKASDGHSKINGGTGFRVKLDELNDYEGLEQLQSRLSRFTLEASPELSQPDKTSIAYRKQQAIKNQLEITCEKVLGAKEKQTKASSVQIEKVPIATSITVP
jgi:hypothetical protein